jgi:hypothetical protein
MRIFKTRWLVRFARRERIPDGSLREAIARAEKGLVDADLGGGLIKLRVARTGKGRSGGYRILVAYRVGDRAVFLYGFAKSDLDNIDQDQTQSLRALAGKWLAADEAELTDALTDDRLQEIEHGEEQ